MNPAAMIGELFAMICHQHDNCVLEDVHADEVL